MSASEEGISAALDDMEIENLVSLLKDDDAVFHELNKLDLPVMGSQYGYVPPTNCPTQTCDEVDLLDFHDALDFFSLQENNTKLDNDDLMTTSSSFYSSSFDPTIDYSSTNCLNPTYGNQQLPQDVLGQLFLADYNGSDMTSVMTIPEIVGPLSTHNSFEPDLAAKQANVCHDHTYAARTGPIDHSSMLTSLSDTVSCDINSGKNSDTDEGSASDTGYDTTTTSPASTRSSFSSPKKISDPVQSEDNQLLPTNLTSSLLPAAAAADLSQLVQDPVKLIDERIKFFMSRQEVHLTEEEKETLKLEGLPIPTTLPLTKTEEKALKTVRRKIRNKLAAQESRKKKKVYMHCLEEQVQQCTKENRKLHKKVETLETENRTLLQQLAHLQTMVARANPILGRQVNLGTCLMVVVLCFGVLCGNLFPYRVSMAANDYSTSAVRSRALLSMDSSSKWMTWIDFYKTLLPGSRDSAHYQPNYHVDTMLNTLWIHCDDNNTLYTEEQHPPLIQA